MFTAGTEDTQMMMNWQPSCCPESDNESDYFADDEISVCSSPSYSEMSDSEPEDEVQNTQGKNTLMRCNT